MTNPSLSAEFSWVQQWIQPQSHVLDLGCGEGQLLSQLVKMRQVKGYGVERDPQSLLQAMAKGIDVLQLDLNETNLKDYFLPQSFDHVIMTQTLQAVKQPDELLKAMVSIGKSAIVTFPNFGHWSIRSQLMFKGRAPESRILPYHWYNTPNIRVLTFQDFERLCQKLDIRILDKTVVNEDLQRHWLFDLMPNLFGEIGMYHISHG